MDVDADSHDNDKECLEASSNPGEVEISSQSYTTIEISGIQPLENSMTFSHADSSQDVNESVSGIYDSFSEDTAEEILNDDDDDDDVDDYED